MGRTQRHRGLAIGTPLGPDTLLLRAISGAEGLSSLFSYGLDLLSEDHAVDFDAIVGQNVTVRIECPKGGTRYINGLVSRFSQRRREGRLASYQATVVPALWMLTRTSDCRIFQEQTVPDIIKEVMKDHGITDLDDRLTASYREWEYCVQYGETDFNFVSRLMEQEGIYYFFEHQDGKHNLVLCDAPTAHKPFGSYAEVSYRPPRQASTDLEHIRDWSMQKAVRPGAFVHDDFDFKDPMKELETTSTAPASHLGADFEIYDYPGEYVEFGDGQTYARVRMEELAAAHEVVGGDSDARGLCTGYKFTLADYPRQDQCREYLLTSVSLNARSDQYDSGDEAGGAFFSCSFSAIPYSVQFRPARSTPKPVIQGVQTAIVVGPSGDEIYTDKHGRVKVQFHWDRRAQTDEQPIEASSCWIRVSQPWAGRKWGGIFIPRIGQEVIVDFVEGDPDRPIITGRVYNGKAKPPYDLPTHKTRSTIKSNSSKGGGGYNEIRFEDKKGSEQIYVHAQMNEDERVENDSLEWIGRDRHLIIKRHQHEKVEENLHLIVVGDHSEKIEGKMSLKIVQDRAVDIGQSASTKIGESHYVSAGINLVLEAGVNITLKVGSNSIALTQAGIFIQGSMVYINSGSGATSGTSLAVKAPEPPKVAATDQAGQVDVAPSAPSPPSPATYSSQAKVLKRAAASGAPFCEVCAGGGGGSGGGEGGDTQPAAKSSGGGTQEGKAAGADTTQRGTGGTQSPGPFDQAGPEGRSGNFQPGRRDGPPGPQTGDDWKSEKDEGKGDPWKSEKEEGKGGDWKSEKEEGKGDPWKSEKEEGKGDPWKSEKDEGKGDDWKSEKEEGKGGDWKSEKEEGKGGDWKSEKDEGKDDPWKSEEVEGKGDPWKSEDVKGKGGEDDWKSEDVKGTGDDGGWSGQAEGTVDGGK